MALIREVRKVAVVGGRGQMGTLCLDRCQRAGIEAVAIDRPLTAAAMAAGLCGADLLYLSVPAPAVDQVLELAAPLLAPGQILADNVSVKVGPMATMLKRWSGPVIGTHPLFGPVPPEHARVAIAPGRDDADNTALAAVEDWTRRMGFVPFRTTAEEHDQAMATIQSLNFVTTVAYLATLSHNDRLKDFLTPSFHRRLEAACKMVTHDGELFTTLFEANPYCQDAVRRFRNILHVAAGGDIDILVQRAKWWWEAPPNSGETHDS